MSVVLRTQLAGVARRPARLLLTGLAVLVASFVVYATVLAQQITERSLLNGLSGTPEAAGLVVRGGTVTTGQLAKIRELPGVAEAVGRADAGGQLGSEYLAVIADPGTGPLSLLTMREGRFPSGPGEVAVTPRTVERMGLAVGATTQLDAGTGKPVPLKVVGVAEGRDDYGFMAYAPLATVSALSGGDVLTQIDIRLAAGADSAALRERLTSLTAGADAPEVATGAEVRLAEARATAGEVDQVFAVVATFVAVAVVAAGLIAASTFRIVFAQRMRQLALLRAIGAGRAPLARALAIEGLLIGLVTGVTGTLAALGVGHLVPVVLRALGWKVSSPGFPVAQALGTVLLAVLITVLAVLAPALSAARVAPLEALRAAASTGAKRGIGALRWAAGLVFVAAAAGVAGLVVANLPGADLTGYDPMPMLLAVVVSGGLAYIALIALGPALVRPVLALTGWPLRRLGPTGRLAVGGVGGSTRRAAAVAVVVALGVTLIAGVLVGGASIRVLSDRELAASAPADFELTGAEGTSLPAGIADRAGASTELTRVTPYRRVAELKVGGLDGVGATDLAMSALPRLADLDTRSGNAGDLGPGRAVLARFVADQAGLRVGDTAEVTAGGKRVSLTVVGVFSDMGPLHSGLLLDPADLTALGAAAAPTGLLADAAEAGEDGRTEGLRALRAAAGGQPGYAVAVLADQRDEMNTALTLLLAIAIGLVGLTVLIAVVGVGATTALSVVERVRESGLLRAIGMSRGGLRAMLTTESALYGVIGAALGLLLGVPYAWLALQATGLNAPLTLPVWQLAAVFLALVALTALAGVLPARRAARVSPVTALGTE
ncbi:FtsX-like permease family protein [Actinoplanes aureus]|uniref:FtsX-like permease family protein n=1 Tax=Actinoplanes aureus TaxID=2792083 RepID=A0A931C7J6_9ACTN|nr:FtsX-like permease family protein [Actinoplanes aureus]MBG0562147.1 FtsX-like permease family protein [Actinoplanes aureus]